MKERSHLTAQGENEFWALRSGTFNTLYQQLNMPNVKKIIRVSHFAILTRLNRFLRTKNPMTLIQSRVLRVQIRRRICKEFSVKFCAPIQTELPFT